MFIHFPASLFFSKSSPPESLRRVGDGDPLAADLADLSALDAESAGHAAGEALNGALPNRLMVVSKQVDEWLIYPWNKFNEI